MKILGLLALFLFLGCASTQKSTLTDESASSQESKSTQESVLIQPKSDEMRNAIRAMIRSNNENYRKCYDGSPEAKTQSTGKLVWHFKFDGKGKVVESKPLLERSTLKSESLLNCFNKTIREMQFPENSANEEIIVVYPFVFKGK